MPNQASFLINLKSTIPETAWSWVISALHQDALIWESLQDPALSAKALTEFGQDSERWSPAGICFLSMDIPLPDKDTPLEPELRMQAIQALEKLIYPTSDQPVAEPFDLAQAGLVALALLENRRKSNSWSQLPDDLEAGILPGSDPVTIWGTVLGVVYGLVEDRLALLKALLRAGAPDAHYRLALHALLSNPRKPADQEQILMPFLHDLSKADGCRLAGLLEQFRPELASRLALHLVDTPHKGVSKTRNSVPQAPASQLADLLNDADIHALAGQIDRANLLRANALTLARDLQADLARRLIQADLSEAGTSTIQTNWNQAVSGPTHAVPPAEMIVNLLDCGAFQEAQSILAQTDLTEDHPYRWIVAAHTAVQRSDHAGARQAARRCLGKLTDRIDPKASSQSEELTSIPTLEMLPLLIHLRDFLLDLSLHTEAARAAELAQVLQPLNADLLDGQSITYRLADELARSLECAHLAVALEPDEVSHRRELAASLEADGDWPAALVERANLSEARFAPASETYWPSASDWHAMANTALHAGDPETALQACQGALEITPEDGLAQALMGEALLVKEMPDLAMEHLHLATQQAPHQPEPWLSLARAYRSTGQIGKAVETLRAASHAVPDHPQVLFALADAYLADNTPTQAQAVLARAFGLATDPAHSSSSPRAKSFRHVFQANGQFVSDRELLCQIALAYGQILLKLGHVDQANRVYETAYQIYPSYPGLAHAHGKTLLATGGLQAALAPLTVAVGASPIDPHPYIDYAQTLLALKENPADAIQALLQALEMIGSQAAQTDDLPTTRLTAQALLAEAYEVAGNLQSSLNTFSQALESGLASTPGWHVRLSLGMARVALGLNQPEIAIAALQEDSRTQPLNPHIHQILAEAYAAIHLPEEALQSAQATVQIAPDDIETLSWFAHLCTQINARAEAIPALNRAMQLDPSDAGLALRLGELLLQVSDPRASQQAFQQVIDNPRASTENLAQAADGLITLGELPAAIIALEHACAAQSVADAHILQRLAGLYEQTGDLPKALETIQKAIEVDPANASFHFYKASLQNKFGRSQAAQASLEHALNLQPGNPAFHLHLAALLRAQGDLSAALLHADAASACAQEAPNHPIARIARGLAADLNRALLQPELAIRSLSGKSQSTLDQFGCAEGWSQSNEAESFQPADQAVYYCIAAELALDEDEEIAAADALTRAIEHAPTALRVQALQSRLAFRRGDQPVALQTLQHALAELENQPTTDESILSSQANNLLALGLAAIDLEQWETALNMLERASAQADHEPLPALHLARVFVRRAEYQRFCQALDCLSHAPGVTALDQNSSQAFQSALQSAFNRLPDDLRAAPPRLYLRWEARGKAIFQPGSESLQTLGELRQCPDDDAAWLGQIAHGGDLVAVNQAYSALLEKYQGTPSHPAILVQVALSKGFKGRRLEDINDSLTAMQSAIDQRPHQPLFHAVLSRLAGISGNLALAQHAILTALSFWPDEPRWHAQAASFYLESGDIPTAISHLEKAVAYEPGYLPHYLALGKAHLQTSQPNQAIAALEQAVKIAPEQAEGHLALAAAYLSSGELQKAANRAQDAIAAAPDQLPPLILRADIAIQMDDPIKARTCAEQALNLQPDQPVALHLYAQALHRLGQTEQAMQVVEKGIPLAADPLPLLLEQTAILESLHGPSATLAALQALADRYPDDPAVLAPLAKSQAENNEIDEAIRTAQRALRSGSHALRPRELASLHHLLGRLLRQSGQLDQAIHQFSEAVRLAPDKLEVYLDLGETQLERRQNTLAIQTYQKAIQVAPEDPRPFYQASLACKAGRDYPGAETMLRRAAELAPDDLVIHRQLAALVALNLVHSRRPVPVDA